MSIKGYDKAKLRSVSGITKAQHDLIYAFLQGAVYVWCKLRPSEWFALRDLMGQGTSEDPKDVGNFFWNGTPMYALWLKHKNQTMTLLSTSLMLYAKLPSTQAGFSRRCLPMISASLTPEKLTRPDNTSRSAAKKIYNRKKIRPNRQSNLSVQPTNS